LLRDHGFEVDGHANNFEKVIAGLPRRTFALAREAVAILLHDGVAWANLELCFPIWKQTVE